MCYDLASNDKTIKLSSLNQNEYSDFFFHPHHSGFVAVYDFQAPTLIRTCLNNDGFINEIVKTIQSHSTSTKYNDDDLEIFFLLFVPLDAKIFI